MITRNQSCEKCAARNICRFIEEYEQEVERIKSALVLRNEEELTVEQVYTFNATYNTFIKLDISCDHFISR
jgi:positive regulator of sigma E activity